MVTGSAEGLNHGLFVYDSSTEYPSGHLPGCKLRPGLFHFRVRNFIVPAFKLLHEIPVMVKSSGFMAQLLTSRATESRLSKFASTPAYRKVTVRNWNTTTKLLKLLEATAA